MSQPPMMAMAVVFPLIRHRPLVLCPLRIATCHRRPLRAGSSGAVGRRRGRKVGHDGVEVPPGPGLEGPAHPIGELVEREPALDHVLAEQGHGAVAVGVRHPLGQAAVRAGGKSRDLGHREVRHTDSLPGQPGRRAT